MPLSALNELLSYAQKQEVERRLYPLWLSHYVISSVSGKEVLPYDELIKKINESQGEGASCAERKIQQRTADDIISDFMPIVNADAKGG